ncbi:MAG: 3'-5' exonuclease [bacterium]|nr:3'-5' exonuclease [bacterium]
MAYVIFDTETTGLSPEHGHKLVEIGAVRVVNGRISQEKGDVFEALINPRRVIPDEVTLVHGITNEMVRNAQPNSVVLPQFLDFVGSDVLVAQNAEFDISFLRSELTSLGLSTAVLNSRLCTIELCKQKFPDLDRYNLNALCRFFGLTIERRHRALDDVLATAEIFLRVHDEEPTLF